MVANISDFSLQFERKQRVFSETEGSSNTLSKSGVHTTITHTDKLKEGQNLAMKMVVWNRNTLWVNQMQLIADIGVYTAYYRPIFTAEGSMIRLQSGM